MERSHSREWLLFLLSWKNGYRIVQAILFDWIK